MHGAKRRRFAGRWGVGSNRSPGNRLHPHRFLVPIALLLIGAVLVLMLWPQERITRQNFGRIRLGMSQAEIHQLLGSPHYQVVEIGLVREPELYATNRWLSTEEKRRSGYRDYRREQWSSPELSISVIMDLQGEVVCRYTGPGHRWEWNWITFLRARLPRWVRTRWPWAYSHEISRLSPYLC
jgi:hypothetical protein